MEAQDADTDNRDKVSEEFAFLEKKDGQWEPEIIKSFSSKPRYTFDKSNPIVDDIAGEMQQADFDIRIRPSGGEATKELAKTYDGIVRNIENISGAKHIFNKAGRDMVAAGIAGWEVTHDWLDGDSFEQDLIIRPIHDFDRRVWFDVASTMQDASDADYVFVLQDLTPDEYEKRFPEGSGMSIGDDKDFHLYQFKPDFITVGRILYKERRKRTLLLLSDGSVREKNEDFNKVSDELAEAGITVTNSRETDSFVVVSRLFDGGAFLTEKQETVFTDYLPIVPTYGNFAVRESKIIYKGAIRDIMDAQRTYNYARSREIEEVALSPRAKYWMTRKQAANPEDRATLQTLNTNADPVQLYTHDPENPGPPILSGGYPINPGLQTTVSNSLEDISTSAGRFGAQEGNIDSPLSGVAIQALQNKGDNSSIKYFQSQEIAECQTGRILVKAIPKVYDTKRQVRILNEDDSMDMVTINDQVYDQETRQFVTVNDLSKGKYDVTCDVGPAFKNRQQESVKALTELIQAIPGVGELSADVLMKNIASPGVDVVGERVRRRLVESGAIPQSQLTDEELKEIQQSQLAAQQNPPPPDPVQQAFLEQTQAQTADVISKAQERADKSQLKSQELLLKEQEQLLKAQDSAEKRDMEELKIMMMQQAANIEQQQKIIEASVKGQAQVFESLNTQANTLKTLREAMGVDTIVGPHATEAYIQQAETITEQQDDIQLTPEIDRVTGR
jgi:hypothetical protein